MSEGSFCPLVGGDCKKYECKFYYQVQGQNPQNGEMISKWDCSIALIPLLLIDNTQKQIQTGAAVDSFRNTMVESNNDTIKVLAAAANLKIERGRG